MRRPVFLIVGTRPEIIKMAPVYDALSARRLRPTLCWTKQHTDLADPLLWDLELFPDISLQIENCDLSMTLMRMQQLLAVQLDRYQPELVLVQGDTTSTFAGALAAFLMKIPVMHIEAGMRTYDMHNPWPEEAYRGMVSRLATYHAAPTIREMAALQREGVADYRIRKTGNTVVDALYRMCRLQDAQQRDEEYRQQFGLQEDRGLILVTCHRRENRDYLDNIIYTAADLAEVEIGYDVVWPVHPNPAVRTAIELASPRNIRFIDPQDYGAFVWLLRQAELVITDSGGVQEEATALGTKTLVIRAETERAAGAPWVWQISPAKRDLMRVQAAALLHAPTPDGGQETYGDGYAADRIADWICEITQ